MERELLTQMLDQLGWIRLHLSVLILVVLLFVAALGGIFVLGWRTSKQMLGADFEKRGRSLLAREKYDELVRLGNKHLEKFPGDASTCWLLSQAHLRLGNLHDALVFSRRTQKLQPDWEQTYTGPMTAFLEARLAEAREKPEFKVVTPNSALNPDGPQDTRPAG